MTWIRSGLPSLVAAAAISLAEPSSAASQTGAEDPEALYQIQEGDDLTIKVFDRPELEETVRVRPDGKISVMLLDDVTAAGLTTAELDRALSERYAEFYREPQVTVIVRTFANFRIFVGGEVAQPGPISLQGKLTALQAVLQAGGFLGTARTDSVVLIRRSQEIAGPRIEKIDLKDVINKGVPDVELEPFDVVYVPMSRIAKMDKFVDQYIRQLLPISLNAGFQYVLGDYRQVIPVVPR